jgi:hypothetical protein
MCVTRSPTASASVAQTRHCFSSVMRNEQFLVFSLEFSAKAED